MNWLETRIPPPILTVALAALAWRLARHLPQFAYPLPGHVWIACIVGCVGLVLNGAPKRNFRRAGTTVNPMRPSNTTALIVTGLHRHSRNPMYLGHAVVLLAWTLYLRNSIGFAAVAFYVGWITRFQIVPEERALAARFGQSYADYCARVRRWI